MGDLDILLRDYADSDMCPMHMPGHKRKSVEEIEDMLEREKGDIRGCEQGDSRVSSVSLTGADPGSTGFHRREPGGERRPCPPVEHLDITEIDGFDNLHRPEGILQDLEADLAALYRVPAAKISVGGSTVGLLAAITAVTAPGDRVLIARNCHTAVYHAALVQGLTVDYLLPEADGSIAPQAVAEAFENNALARMIREMAEGRPLGPEAAEKSSVAEPTENRSGKNSEPEPAEKHVVSLSDNERPGNPTGKPAVCTTAVNKKMSSVRSFPADSLKDGPAMKAAPYKAVVITCPTYEGIMSDIAAIAKIVHSYGAVLIVDAAHGAHLGLSEEPIFPENPVHCGADIVVVSLHKTLPALTMTGAILFAHPAENRKQAGRKLSAEEGQIETCQASSVEDQRLSEANSVQAAEDQRLSETKTVQSAEDQRLSETKTVRSAEDQRLPETKTVQSKADQRPSEASLVQDLADRVQAVAAALDIYESSSPSYILLASIARLVRFLREHGAEVFHLYAQKLTAFYRAVESFQDPAVLGCGDSPYALDRRAVTVDGFSLPVTGNGIFLQGSIKQPSAVTSPDDSLTNAEADSPGEKRTEYGDDKLDSESPTNGSFIKKDPSKIVIISKNDIINRLRSDYHIELEMASLSYALAMTSLVDSAENFDRLLAALADMNGNPPASGNPALQTGSPPEERRREGIVISGEEENNPAGADASQKVAAGDFVKQNSVKISGPARATGEGPSQAWDEGRTAGDDRSQAWDERRTAGDDCAQAWDEGRTGDKSRGARNFALDLPFTADGYKLPQQVLSIREAWFAPSEAAAIGAAAGRISAAFVSVFPPEIPILVPGERIGEPELKLLKSASARGFTIHGLIDGKIRILK